MNKFSLNLLGFLYPFYPILGWFTLNYLNTHIDKIANAILMPLAFYYIISGKAKFPIYLRYYLGFLVIHIFNVIYNDLIPYNINKFFYFLSDFNVYAFIILIIIENTDFTDSFIKKMQTKIVIVVITSLLVSLVQVLNPLFFATTRFDSNTVYIIEERCFSIYSWIYPNTLGITFPFLISIMLSYYLTLNRLMIIVLIGMIVAFLSKARYLMISIIITISQLLITKVRSISARIKWIFLIFITVLVFLLIIDKIGIDIYNIIDDRILEKKTELRSANARIASYYVFLIKFPENPWLGVGPYTRDDVVNLLEGQAPMIHVGYLAYLYYYGVFGAGFLFISVFHLVKRAWLIGKNIGFWAGFYGLIAFCFANTTMVYFNLSEMGILLSVIYFKYLTKTAQKRI